MYPLYSILRSDIGDVYTCGLNSSGQLGTGDVGSHAYQPTLVDMDHLQGPQGPDICIADISCGSRHTLARDFEGAVYAWGWNGRGQVTNQQHDRDIVGKPIRVQMAAAVSHVAAGHWHSSCVL